MKNQLFIFILILSFFSCEKKENIASANLKLDFANLMNNSPLTLQTARYANTAGNSFSIDKFQYYISNIRLKNTQTGQTFTESESYHLLERKAGSHIDEILIKNVPVGQYNQLEFAVGIDKASNLSTDQVGDLDPSNDMAWDWKTGYKFLLLEGSSFAQTGERRGMVIHIGSDENYRTINLKVSPLQNLSLEEGKSTTVSINVEVSKLFNAPNVIDVEKNRTIMFGGISGQVADNYVDMFSIQRIEKVK